MKKEQAFVAIYLLAPNISNTSNYKIVIYLNNKQFWTIIV